MTTIIGIQHNNGCTLVADSLVSDDNGRTWSHPEMTKINKRGAFLIAGAGEVGPCDIAQHIWEPPVLTVKDKKDVYHFMITKAMPSLRECLKANGYNFDEPQDKDSSSRFQFLMAVNGELFDIGDDLSIMRSGDGFYGIGSGAQIALGALHAGAEAVRAVEIAAKLSIFSSGPFQTEIQFTK
jgi:ATP-dependent protease HslVU (ClpYQ) peptidase subunit